MTLSLRDILPKSNGKKNEVGSFGQISAISVVPGELSNRFEERTISDRTKALSAILLALIMVGSSFFSILGPTDTNGSKSIVLDAPGQESIVTRVYDMFNVSLGGWWSDRYNEQIIQSTFPVAYKWFGTPAGNTYIYSDYRMNVTAKNISKVNTSDNPWYVPILNPSVRGGNISMDWHANYLTKSEAVADYQKSISDWYDSWFWRWNGTVTMDRTAAKMVLNMTDMEFDNFTAWKASKFPPFKQKFSTWVQDQMNVVWAIKFSYEYEGNTLFESYDIQKVGDTIVFQILDHLSWGAECLLGRWWSHTFVQFEGWPEDVHFTAQMGPASSNFNLDMAVQYSLFAATGTRDSRTCWIFENTHADAVPGTSGSYVSEFNPYFGESYWCKLIANSGYQNWHSYDYTPWAWNLTSVNHKIIIEWPDSSAVIGYQYNGTNDCNKTVVGQITPIWVEPLPGELPSNVQVNSANRTIEITGPLDTLAWSKTTSNISELQENWTRVGHLPHGCPYVEFAVTNDWNQSPIAAFNVPAYAATGANITLDGSASWDPDGSIVSYDWGFGDGSPDGTGVVVSHTWAVSGNYTVTLKVTDNSSRSSSISKDIQVMDTLDPVAVINGDGNGAVGELMQFDGLGSYDLDGSIASYLWEFSDGGTATGPVAYRVSPDYCNYTVELTVTDNLGATDTASLLVIIGLGSPVAKIAMPEKATVGENVFISGVQSYSPTGMLFTNYSWDFGDGSVGYDNESTHSWASTGSYIVTLLVKDNLGSWSRPACAIIDILPAGATAVSVSLEKHSLLPSEATTLTLAIVDASGNVVTDFTGDVSITCNESTGVTIPSAYTFTLGDAGAHEFVDGASFSLDGSYNISASVDLNANISGYDFATVCNRTVEIRIYDIFKLPLPDYWLKRSQIYLLSDEGFRNTSPAVGILRMLGVQTAGQLWTTYMMNIEARNVEEINMSSPTFAALRNPTTGKGNATVVIDYHMMTEAEVNARDGIYYPAGKAASWDGWEYFLTYNVTMDRAATEQIINLPSASWTSQADVDTWWAANNLTVSRVWNRNVYLAEPGYLGAEGGFGVAVGRLDIRCCEDYYNYGQGLWSSMFRLQYLDANHTSLTYFNVGYGYDALLSRFLYWGGIGSGANYPNGTPNGIVPYEPWYDNMSLRVDICDDRANVSMYAGVVFGFRAWKSDVAPEGTAVWRWETQRLDYTVSTPGGLSEIDIYAPYRNSSDPRYQRWDPGSSQWGMTTQYDYVPAVMTLKPGESIIIEEPRSMAVGYRPKGMTGDPTDGSTWLGGYYDSLRMLERFGNASIHAIGTPPGTAAIDARTGDLKIVGPFVPIIKYRSDIPWLVDEPAPRIELWVGPMEVHAPCAAFTVSPVIGNTATVFNFNASFSCDVEDTPNLLEFRWDWTGDGTWDTDWSYTNITTVQIYPVAGNYTVRLEVRDSSGLTDIAEGLVQATLLPTSSEFSPPHSDHGLDLNSNGLFDYLIVNVSLSIATAGTYVVGGMLNDTSGAFAFNVTTVYLDAGMQNAYLQYLGMTIYENGYSGNFTIDLLLFSGNATLLDTDSYTTNFYTYDQFEAPSQFVPPTSDHGNDTTGDGLYEFLSIHATANITTPGWYELDGYLYDSGWGGIDWGYEILYLDAGIQPVEIQFSGSTIYNYGYNGAFFVDLYLYLDGTYLDFESHTTNWYNHTDFDSTFQPAHFVPPYSDYGEDLNSNGFYDDLVMDVPVYADAAGWYWISGELFDGSFSYISWWGDDYYLNTGLQTIQIPFLGGAIYNHGYNGSYFVTIELYDGPSMIDNDTYVTNAYTFDQFELPPDHFAPPHSDHGLDTNSNGLYDYLIVNVSVDITNAGWYLVGGDIFDSSWDYLGSAFSGSIYLNGGAQIIELWFDGTMLGDSGYDGVYWVDLYLYGTLNLTDYDSYTTGWYNCSQFESSLTAYFVPPFSDYGEDLDADGIYDNLVVGAPVFVNAAGWYTITCEIGDGVGYNDSESVTSYLFYGLQTVELRFNGTALFNNGYDGTYNVSLSLYDSNLSFVDSGSFTTNFYMHDEFGYGVDSTPPVTGCTLSGALGANGWYVSTVNAVLGATDFESGVNHTYYRLRTDGGAWSSWTTYSGQISLTVNGTHNIEYYSTDMAGNQESVKSDTVKLDKAAPDTTSSSYAYNLVLSSTDNAGGSGVNSTWYRIWSGSWGAWIKYTGTVALGTTGNIAVQFRSIDNAGNTETADAISLPIADSLSPVTKSTLIGILGENNWYVSQVNLTLTATDDLSGVSSTHYRLDGGNWETYSSAIQLTAGGTHRIEFYATDNYGNDEDVQTVTVKVDRTMPTSTVSVEGSMVAITASDGVNCSGVNKTFFRIDGGNWTAYISPFNVTGAGAHLIEYYSVDKAGNIEGNHSITVTNPGQGGISGIPVELLLILILIIVAVVLVVLFIMRRKGTGKQLQ